MAKATLLLMYNHWLKPVVIAVINVSDFSPYSSRYTHYLAPIVEYAICL